MAIAKKGKNESMNLGDALAMWMAETHQLDPTSTTLPCAEDSDMHRTTAPADAPLEADEFKNCVTEILTTPNDNRELQMRVGVENRCQCAKTSHPGSQQCFADLKRANLWIGPTSAKTLHRLTVGFLANMDCAFANVLDLKMPVDGEAPGLPEHDAAS